MDESTMRQLLAYTVRCLLTEKPVTDEAIQGDDALAERIADACFDGLVVAIRDSFASRQQFSIADVGSFSPGDFFDQAIFAPAASLVEAEAIGVPPDEGRVKIARRALFYLKEGIKLLNDCGSDVALGKIRPAQNKYAKSVFGDKMPTSLLSLEIDKLRSKLDLEYQRLRPSWAEFAPVRAQIMQAMEAPDQLKPD